MDALFGASDPSMVSIVPPRGRTYARNGAIVDLQIEPGRVTAIVSGSDIYEIAIEIDRLDRKVWKRIVRECTGQIGSMVELLQGRFSDEVMRILARPRTGLFPSPKQIRLSEPEIFFALRQVDQTELIGEAATAKRLGTRKRVGKRTLANADLEGVFGIEPGVSGSVGARASARLLRWSIDVGCHCDRPTTRSRCAPCTPTTSWMK